uniref:Uncharacterized protein n=1 Tax=Anguilla anguilla TaxID=7936 RepID=A0A0E9SER5_ANGAN
MVTNPLYGIYYSQQPFHTPLVLC